MSMSLTKQQKVSLKKSDGTNIEKLEIALGWEMIHNSNKYNERGLAGFIKVLFGLTASSNMDCDLSCVCAKNGKIDGKTLVYFGSPNYKKAIKHSGDDLVGGKGDRERIKIDTSKLDEDIDRVYIFVNVYNCERRHQNFGMVENAYVRVIDDKTGDEFCRYELVDDYGKKTGIIVGQLIKEKTGSWEFYADGEGLDVKNIVEIINILKAKKG